MQSFKLVLAEAIKKEVSVGHFNISDSVTLRAIFEAARELNVPVLIGTSEGEREFVGVQQAVALVRSLREEYDYPIYLNADHTHSFEKIKEAVDAGYDAVLFDGGKLSLEDNIRETKKVVQYVKSMHPEVLVEGELGYIGSSSAIFDKIPEGAAIKPEDLTTPEDAARFVNETGVDLLAPAVGNVHGMFANAPNPRLDIARIAAIAEAVKIPLVLHGGSGTADEDFTSAIRAGVRIVHINTELRLAWRKGIEEGLSHDKNEVAPYKIYAPALRAMKEVIRARLALFSKG